MTTPIKNQLFLSVPEKYFYVQINWKIITLLSYIKLFTTSPKPLIAPSAMYYVEFTWSSHIVY